MSIIWTESPKHYGYRVARKVGDEMVVRYFDVCNPEDVALLTRCSPDLRKLIEERIRVGKEIANAEALAFDEKLDAQQRSLIQARENGQSPKPQRPSDIGPERLFPITELDGFALLFSPGGLARWSFVIGTLSAAGVGPDAVRIGFERSNVASRLELAFQAWGRCKDRHDRQSAAEAVRLVQLVRFLKSIDPHF
jgi:hypothetical protein